MSAHPDNLIETRNRGTAGIQAISTNDFKPGVNIELENAPWRVQGIFSFDFERGLYSKQSLVRMAILVDHRHKCPEADLCTIGVGFQWCFLCVCVQSFCM